MLMKVFREEAENMLSNLQTRFRETVTTSSTRSTRSTRSTS